MIMLGRPDGRDAGVLRKTKDEDFARLLRNPPPEVNDIGKYLFILNSANSIPFTTI